MLKTDVWINWLYFSERYTEISEAGVRKKGRTVTNKLVDAQKSFASARFLRK